MKKRLDLLLVERGLAESRTRAQALVLEGKVRVSGQVETKASRQLEVEVKVEVESVRQWHATRLQSPSIS